MPLREEFWGLQAQAQSAKLANARFWAMRVMFMTILESIRLIVLKLIGLSVKGWKNLSGYPWRVPGQPKTDSTSATDDQRSRHWAVCENCSRSHSRNLRRLLEEYS
jgi:hypothetical protein